MSKFIPHLKIRVFFVKYIKQAWEIYGEDFADKLLEITVKTMEVKDSDDLQGRITQAERDRIKKIIFEVTKGFGNHDVLIERIDRD